PTTTIAPATPTTTVDPTTTVTPTFPATTPTVTLDQVVSRNIAAGSDFRSAALTTSGPDELLVAFLSSDGPAGSGQQSVTGVAGGNLTWTLVVRSDFQYGDAEIWTAFSPEPVSSMTVTASRSAGGYEGSITLAAFKGAAPAPGAASVAGSPSGQPIVTMTTTAPGSLVWGVGHDWDNPTSRHLGRGQVMVHQYLDHASDDTSWVQRVKGPIATSGTTTSIIDTRPTSDQWDLAAVEIVP
ncbi:MAG: hypothetical protein ACRDZX_02265, partial [Acidimicrobiales bacterium]